MGRSCFPPQRSLQSACVCILILVRSSIGPRMDDALARQRQHAHMRTVYLRHMSTNKVLCRCPQLGCAGHPGAELLLCDNFLDDRTSRKHWSKRPAAEQPSSTTLKYMNAAQLQILYEEFVEGRSDSHGNPAVGHPQQQHVPPPGKRYICRHFASVANAIPSPDSSDATGVCNR